MPIIEVDNLTKIYKRAVRKSGAFGAVRTFLSREVKEIRAVEDVSFRIDPGEIVGYIGPNGAGKSTTLKMLTGILVPSSGSVSVDGRVPFKQRVEHARRIGVVFGQRSQLWWDLPTIESFELLRHIYKLSYDAWRRNMNMFQEVLDLNDFLETPVRQLSLGQRMRADLAAALLHDPPILFLDEPTIGLDVVAKEKIRRFLLEINAERKTTIILTTHDLADIERLCPRVILIDSGKLVYDGALEALRERFGRYRTLVVDLEDGCELGETPGAEIVRTEGPRVWLRFNRQAISASGLIQQIAARCPIRDLTVEEPELEAIVRDIYQGGMAG